MSMYKNLKIFTVSADGKTISIGGKTYSRAAFKSQFMPLEGTPIKAGTKGEAVSKSDYDARKKAPIKIDTTPKPSAGKTRMGSLGTGRGGAGIGGMFGIKNR